VTAFGAPVADALVAGLAPSPGNTVLDLAAGTGDVTEVLAQSGVRVISTDVSPVMVEAARRRGIPGVEHRVMDMQAIDLPDSSVDGVVSRYGYMLVADPALALRETRRVLRPGGRLAFATWAPANRNPWATAYGPVLIDRGLLEPPKPGEPGQFSLGEPARIEELVRGGGFDDVSVAEVPVVFRAASWAEYRRIVSSLAASMREVLEQLDEAARAQVDEAARARIEPYRSGERYDLPGVSLVTTAS
jgi:SAM-dependent methyltransferase